MGEKLVKPCAVKDMAREVCGEVVANKLKQIPLSNSTIKRRIDAVSNNILEKLIAAIKLSEKFSLQLDETTDMENFAQLILFVRYRSAEDYVEEFH